MPAKTRTRSLDESTRLVLAGEVEGTDWSFPFFCRALTKKTIWDDTSRMAESDIIVWQVVSCCKLAAELKHVTDAKTATSSVNVTAA